MKRFPTTDDATVRAFKEGKLLNDVTAVLRVRTITMGKDSAEGYYYHVMELPGPVQRVGLPLGTAAIVRVFREVAITLSALHARRVAYRNFATESFIMCDDAPILYELSRAADVDGGDRVDGIVADPYMLAEDRVLTRFDPPEAQQQSYDGFRADVYGLGVLMSSAQWEGARYQELVQQMMAPNPVERPSMSRVAELLR